MTTVSMKNVSKNFFINLWSNFCTFTDSQVLCRIMVLRRKTRRKLYDLKLFFNKLVSCFFTEKMQQFQKKETSMESLIFVSFTMNILLESFAKFSQNTHFSENFEEIFMFIY